MSDLKERTKRIKSLADQGRFEDALASCDSLLEQSPGLKGEILRARAYVYSVQGRYDLAIADRRTLIESGEGLLRDYYQIGDNSMSAGLFEDASGWFIEILRLGAEQNEKWFESAALLLLSFAQLQLGRLQEASRYLDQAVSSDPECAMPVRGHGMINPDRLRKEIARRLGTSS